MIYIEQTEIYGFEAAIRGMRNPMNSWDKSDSEFGNYQWEKGYLHIGENDLKLMQNLVKAGTDHSKFMRMISVSCDINAPLYWWKEYSTYKVGTVANSCSTMHKIQDKELTLDDFSCEHLLYDFEDVETLHGTDCKAVSSMDVLSLTVELLNTYRKKFLETNDKDYWWQMIQLLPASYNQKRTVTLNYAVLRNMYHARKNHKLDEWHTFCAWVETLPYAKELIMIGDKQ